MVIGHYVRPYAQHLNSVKGEEVEYIEFLDPDLKHYERHLKGETLSRVDSVGKSLILDVGDYSIFIDLGMHGKIFLKKWEAKNQTLIKLRLKIGDKYFFIYAPTTIRLYPKGQL